MPDLRSRPIRHVLLLVLMMLAVGAARASADTFDILSFTPPAKWEKTVSGTTFVRFKGYNAKHTAFCEFDIFGSRPSAGCALKDFEDEWNDITLNKTPWEGTPKATTIRSGWTAVSVQAHIKPKDFVPFVSTLTSSVLPIDQAAAAVPPSTSPASPPSQAASADKGGTTFVINNHLSRDIIYLYVKLVKDPSRAPICSSPPRFQRVDPSPFQT